MRGEARVKQDSEVTADDIATSNLILWGDAAANSVTAKVLAKLPVQWDGSAVTVGTKTIDGAQHVPALIYPNPLNPAKYVVLNSGLTFREAHDKTNSQQNPKLPDWAVIDIRTDRSRVVDAEVIEQVLDPHAAVGNPDVKFVVRTFADVASAGVSRGRTEVKLA